MRVSFDLDNTLICYQVEVPREPRLPWYLRLIAGDEPLRLGARQLLSGLRDQGWEVWIYTTSYRSPTAVRRWLRCHGVVVTRVINQNIHNEQLAHLAAERRPSKNPAEFGIALHVDDSEGVRIEGERHGFSVVIVAPEDDAWAEKVKRAAERRVAKWQSRKVAE